MKAVDAQPVLFLSFYQTDLRVYNWKVSLIIISTTLASIYCWSNRRLVEWCKVQHSNSTDLTELVALNVWREAQHRWTADVAYYICVHMCNEHVVRGAWCVVSGTCGCVHHTDRSQPGTAQISLPWRGASYDSCDTRAGQPAGSHRTGGAD